MQPRGKADQQVATVHQEESESEASTILEGEDPKEDLRSDDKGEIYVVDLRDEFMDEFQKTAAIGIPGKAKSDDIVRIDTGCPISLIRKSLVNHQFLSNPGSKWNKYYGINNSRLQGNRYS